MIFFSMLVNLSFLLDKGTIKHNTSQLTLRRAPCLRNGVLFEKFFIGSPIVTNNSGLALTQLLVDVIIQSLNWTIVNCENVLLVLVSTVSTSDVKLEY